MAIFAHQLIAPSLSQNHLGTKDGTIILWPLNASTVMTEQRPRIQAETIEQLSKIVGTIDGIDVEQASVDQQIRLLVNAHRSLARERRELALHLRAINKQRQSDSFFSTPSKESFDWGRQR